MKNLGIYSIKDAGYWLYLSGCILLCAYLVFGTIGCVKRYHSGPQGTTIDFATGFDVGAQLNGIDTVQDSRGIKPNRE